MVAGLGLSAFHPQAQNTPSPESTTRIPGTTSPYLKNLALLPDSGNRRLSFSVDYWHQHAIRTVIRHLTFAVSLPAATDATPLHAQQNALLGKLSALLTLEHKPPVIVRRLTAIVSPIVRLFRVTDWISLVQGIRAGPLPL